LNRLAAARRAQKLAVNGKFSYNVAISFSGDSS
jgi:hypothetical protein